MWMSRLGEKMYRKREESVSTRTIGGHAVCSGDTPTAAAIFAAIYKGI